MKHYEIVIRDRAAEIRAQDRADRRREQRIDAWIDRVFAAVIVAVGIAVMALVLVGILVGCSNTGPVETSGQDAEPAIPSEAVRTDALPTQPAAQAVAESTADVPDPVDLVCWDIKGPLLETAPEAWAGPGEAPPGA